MLVAISSGEIARILRPAGALTRFNCCAGTPVPRKNSKIFCAFGLLTYKGNIGRVCGRAAWSASSSDSP